MRGWLYDTALVGLTSRWYGAVLARLPQGARVLDVGIGTAGALLRHASVLDAHDLRIVGIDIDADYVRRARRRVERLGLTERVEVRHEGLFAHEGGPYDAVYFAGSFMLFDEPDAALETARGLLAPEGRVYFTQTFQERESAVLERVKPLLGRVTTIDFGQVTYEREFLDTLAASRFDVEDQHVLGGRARRRTSRLVVAAPS